MYVVKKNKRGASEGFKFVGWKEEWCEPRTQRQKMLLLIFLTILTSALFGTLYQIIQS